MTVDEFDGLNSDLGDLLVLEWMKMVLDQDRVGSYSHWEGG